MRFLIIFTIGISLIGSSIWVVLNYPEVRSIAIDYLQKGKLQTLEVRHSAENIMDSYRRELLKDSEHVFLEPTLTFHPYLLMEVKYTRSNYKTGEGVILWSLVDGEMVINTNSWEKTHGFNDCLVARAGREDFKIINTLSNYGGSLDRESLLKILNVENDTLDLWVDKCRLKNLIVQNGNHFRLHLQEPKLQIVPETKLDQWLVSKPSKNANRISKKFWPSQIEGIAKAAFGNDFAIRKTTEIFLPVYSIVVQNPDGSQMTTYWNALNGKRLSQSYHLE
jgi:hypothetical protein